MHKISQALLSYPGLSHICTVTLLLAGGVGLMLSHSAHTWSSLLCVLSAPNPVTR